MTAQQLKGARQHVGVYVSSSAIKRRVHDQNLRGFINCTVTSKRIMTALLKGNAGAAGRNKWT